MVQGIGHLIDLEFFNLENNKGIGEYNGPGGAYKGPMYVNSGGSTAIGGACLSQNGRPTAIIVNLLALTL
jgi:hypothetical protein